MKLKYLHNSKRIFPLFHTIKTEDNFSWYVQRENVTRKLCHSLLMDYIYTYIMIKLIVFHPLASFVFEWIKWYLRNINPHFYLQVPYCSRNRNSIYLMISVLEVAFRMLNRYRFPFHWLLCPMFTLYRIWRHRGTVQRNVAAVKVLCNTGQPIIHVVQKGKFT
jgi:hypothetical protein